METLTFGVDYYGDNLEIIEEEKTLLGLAKEGYDALLAIGSFSFSIQWKAPIAKPLRIYYFSMEGESLKSHERDRIVAYCDYERRHGRKVVIVGPRPDLSGEAGELPARVTPCKGCLRRACETDLLAHTTSIWQAKKILKEGALVSRSYQTDKELFLLHEDANNPAGDPMDYFQYVMLSYGNCPAGLRLLQERLSGEHPSNEAFEKGFVPGVIFFFDRRRLSKYQGFTLDGYHHGKVFERLPLKDFLLTSIGPEGADLDPGEHPLIKIPAGTNGYEFVDRAYEEALQLYYHQLFSTSSLEEVLPRLGRHDLFAHGQAVQKKWEELVPDKKSIPLGLLHDIGQVIHPHHMVMMAQHYGLELLKEEEAYPFLLHQKLSCYIAKRYYGISDEEVLKGIRYHTTGNHSLTQVAKAVFMADKLSWEGAEGVNKDHSIDVWYQTYFKKMDPSRVRVLHPETKKAIEEA